MTFVKSHYNIARTISYSTAQAELEKEGLKKKDVVKELAKYGDGEFPHVKVKHQRLNCLINGVT